MRRNLFVMLIAVSVFVIGRDSRTLADPPPPAAGSVLWSPCNYRGLLKGQEGTIVVPENRAASGSRMIGVHFFRFPAQQPSELAPVFFLPGGPGGFFDEGWMDGLRNRSTRFSVVTEIRAYNKTRDVILVNQRGNADGPGLESESMVLIRDGSPLNKPMTIDAASKRLKAGAKKSFDRWQSRGMDLAGYDILNMVDDIDDLRRAFGYETIALRGGSFGSQWSLAYMKRYPDRVDRALLGGIEPLDHAYDSPQGIWNVFMRLEEQVVAEGKIKLPDEGLLGAVKTIIQRLEKKPVVVRARHPLRNTFADVTIGADDFRKYLRHNLKRSLRQSLEAWPKFVLEVYHEDYRYLASKVYDDRPEQIGGILLGKLVDNSLGISAAREAKLKQEPASRWLGDINWFFIATRDVTPTPVVDDAFRAMEVSLTPVLMIHGDMDLSTPLENAQELLQSLPNGHLIRVEGGTHGAVGETVNHNREFLKTMVKFMNADFEQAEPKTLLKQMPQSVALPKLKFKTTDGPTLFEDLFGGK